MRLDPVEWFVVYLLTLLVAVAIGVAALSSWTDACEQSNRIYQESR